MPTPTSDTSLSRRKFLALSGAGTAAIASGALLGGQLVTPADAQPLPTVHPLPKYPIGIELYAVRGELARNLPDTLRTVPKSGELRWRKH